MKKLLFAAAATFCLSTAAHGAVNPVLDTVTPFGDGTFTFSYVGTLAGDQGLINGSRLIIFDFAGYVAGSVAAVNPDVLATTELTSTLFSPGGDDPTIPNLVYTWNGGPFQNTGGPFPDADFAGLTARSTFSGISLTSFSAQTVTNNGAATGTAAFNQGTVGAPAPIPEPASWALLILGFGAAGATLRARRRLVTAFS